MVLSNRFFRTFLFVVEFVIQSDWWSRLFCIQSINRLVMVSSCPGTIGKGKEEGEEKHTSTNIQNKCQWLRYSENVLIPLYRSVLIASYGSFRKNGIQSPIAKGEVKNKDGEYVHLFSTFHSCLPRGGIFVV